jgi:predicted PP-loop superfamily ATPase
VIEAEIKAIELANERAMLISIEQVERFSENTARTRAPDESDQKHMTTQPRFTKKRIARTTTATSIAISTTFDSVMFSTSKRLQIMTRSLHPRHVHNHQRY